MKRRFRHKDVEQQEGDVEDESHMKKCKKTQRIKIGSLVCLLVAILAILTPRNSARREPVLVSYAPPNNVTNKLLATFEKVISSADLILPPGYDAYVPLIIKNRKIFCRGSHKDIISNARIRSYIEMLEGMELNDFRTKDETIGFPVILLESDNSGCHDPRHVKEDKVSFPRLAWHTPAPKYGTGWCKAISMVGYESINSFRKKHTYYDTWFFDYTWDHTFKKDERKYPWLSKLDKALWRGSTTGPSNLGPHNTFGALSRAHLVKKSMDRPDLIDAGFTSFVQGWESKKLSNQTIVAGHMRFVDQMKYRAIIDIDGNAWSSRFSKILCTNSVAIKIDPDYIEYFYADLQPMVHYVPASLENITEVAQYVLDKNNRLEMKGIVDAANSWCKKTNTKEQLPRDAIVQLKKYEAALYDAYNSSWVDEWRHVRSRILNNIGDDLVECSSFTK